MDVGIGKMTLSILPEVSLVIFAAIILVLDLAWQDRRCRKLGWLTVFGLSLSILISFFFSIPTDSPMLIWGGMLRVDWITFVFRLVFLSGALITTLQALESPGICDRGEFYFLLLISTLGMSLMASSADLVMLYLSMETTAIPLYVLAGFRINDQRSVEAGIKYFLFGATASTAMLFGFSLLFGFTGTTGIYSISEILTGGPEISTGLLILPLLLVLVGFGFKISAVPFHFWAPDVYEGSPTPIAGFLSTASKGAGFAVLLRFLFSVMTGMIPVWVTLVVVLSIASMVLGNLLAMVQKNIKRLLAYSSIAQAGYMLIGVAAGSSFGASAVTYYLIGYLVTNLAAFGIVNIIGRYLGSDEIASYAGLNRRSPALALGLLVAMLSLAGIPPFAGFIGKILVLGAAVQSGQVALAVIGVLNSVAGLYYYLIVLKVAYGSRSEEEGGIVVPFSGRIALIFCIFAVIAIGVLISPLLGWTHLVGHLFLNY